MGEFTLPGNPPIEVVMRRSARARRISLRLSRLDGRVTMTLPRHVAEREAHDFAREKEAWLRGHLSEQPATVPLQEGEWLPIEGRMHRIGASSGRSVRAQDGEILVPGAEDRFGARLAGYLKVLARDRLTEASDRHSAALGRPYTRLTLRDTRSRWGSCTHDGGLMYSWRLVMAPPEVLDYVAAHEVAHLAEMNHSQAFWREVTRLYGDWKPARTWLRDHGAELHRYRFGD
ncbi:M48 family metallopeptidase [Primorskyibacter sedentarius]|uniref:M48 family metallopeptidase n=1 Tax=Primorskyibacter sedentarius TaxID=745311 RepID=UPI003EC02728